MNTRIQALPGRTTRDRHVDVYLRVLNALMLRDMRSRFGGSYWGYLLQVLWPSAHVIVIVSLMTFRGVPSPMGDSAMLFVATGAVPALGFKYISREVMKGYSTHKSLTYFPQVKRFDTIVARILVEIVSSFMAIAVVCTFLLAAGVDPVPVDISTAMSGYLVGIMLGIGVGTVNVGIVSMFPAWQIIYTFFGIVLYIMSGITFMPCYMPEAIYDLMKWNPLVQVVEWVRLGYEPNLPIQIDYLYLAGWIFTSLTIGLILERTVVRRNG